MAESNNCNSVYNWQNLKHFLSGLLQKKFTNHCFRRLNSYIQPRKHLWDFVRVEGKTGCHVPHEDSSSDTGLLYSHIPELFCQNELVVSKIINSVYILQRNRWASRNPPSESCSDTNRHFMSFKWSCRIISLMQYYRVSTGKKWDFMNQEDEFHLAVKTISSTPSKK